MADTATTEPELVTICKACHSPYVEHMRAMDISIRYTDPIFCPTSDSDTWIPKTWAETFPDHG